VCCLLAGADNWFLLRTVSNDRSIELRTRPSNPARRFAEGLLMSGSVFGARLQLRLRPLNENLNGGA
jgi:hypothetical protein